MEDKEIEKSKKTSLPKWYRFLKENLTIMLLIPTLLGGMWQVLELWGFGFAYIRFFSVTQLISDGLLLMILIPILLIFPTIAYFIGKWIRISISESKSKRNLFSIIIWFLIFSTILIYVNYVYLDYVASLFTKKINITLEIFAFVLIFPLFQGFYYLSESIVDKIKAYKKRDGISKVKKNIATLGTNFMTLIIVPTLAASVMVMLVIAFKVLISLGDYFIPNNLVNVINIERIMCDSYSLSSEEYKISYFNDSYIFVEHVAISDAEVERLRNEKKDIPTEIIILEFDTLFNHQ